MSATQGYSGINSYIFLIDEIAGYGCGGYGGTIAIPVAPDSDDLHIPFNPVTEIAITLPTYGIIEKTYIGNSIPSRQSTVLELGSLTVASDYHAPFVMSRFFTGKHYGGSWSTSTETVTMGLESFETTTNSIALHMHIDNRNGSADDIDLNVYGGYIKSYSWSIAETDVLKEEIEFDFSNWDESAIAFNTASNYHNRKYALWNGDRVLDSSKVLSVSQQKITVSTGDSNLESAIACRTESSIKITSERDNATCLGFESNSFSEKKGYDIEASMTVKIKDNYPLTQIRTRFESREDITFKILVTEGVRSEYIQCTKMKISDIGEVTIPDPTADASMGLTFTFKATDTSVVTYNGIFNASTTSTPVIANKPGYIKYIS